MRRKIRKNKKHICVHAFAYVHKHIYYIYICRLVANSYLTLLQPMDYSQTGSSVHGVSQTRILEWVAISLPRASS